MDDPGQEVVHLAVSHQEVNQGHRAYVAAAYKAGFILVWALPPEGPFEYQYKITMEAGFKLSSLHFRPQDDVLYVFAIDGGYM